MKTGLVSIMMPAYNAEAYIHQAIESAISQSYPYWELIVVDDGSTDRTAEIASLFKDSRIKLVGQENGGEAMARNTALQQMEGEWIAFLDADDAFLPDHLNVAVNALREHPEWDGVYTDGLHIDTEGRELPRLSSRRRGPFEGWLFDKLVWGSDVFGPPLCVMIRREQVLSRELHYDPRIVIGPDWDFFLRYSEHASFGYRNEVTCKYRIHQTNISLRSKAQVKLDSLALCRIKAIQLESFSKCPLETRSFVFFELLINLLDGKPDEQDAILHGKQFLELPLAERARLLRLVAGKALASGTALRYPQKWLADSRELQPRDRHSLILSLLLKFSPGVACEIMRRRYANRKDELMSPFSDLMGV
jgi:glycosyltransferase involved in cell wall biosynthesis